MPAERFALDLADIAARIARPVLKYWVDQTARRGGALMTGNACNSSTNPQFPFEF